MIKDGAAQHNNLVCHSTGDSIPSDPENSANTVRIVHHNVQSLGNCLTELETWVNTAVACDLLCLTEHWRSAEELASVKIRNFSLASGTCRNSGRHGGAAVFARDYVSIRVREDLNKLTTLHEFECAGAEALIAGRPWIVAAVYRTEGNVDLFIEQMNALLTICLQENKPYIICGDFNIDLKRCSRDMLDFVELLNSFNAVFTIDEFTRITNKTRTCIDNVIIPSGIQFWGAVAQPGYSDHTAQVVGLSVGGSGGRQLVMRRRYSDDNVGRFLADLRSVSWREVYQAEGVDNKWDAFSQIFTGCFETTFPMRRYGQNYGRKNMPWVTPQISEMRERVSVLQLISSYDEDYKQYFRAYKGMYNSELQAAKNRYYQEKINSSNNRSRATWKVINSLVERSRGRRVLPDGNPANLASDFNNHFSGASTDLAFDVPPDSYRNLLSRVDGSVNSFFLEPVTEGEVLNICKRLSNSHSFGHDNVPVHILKICVDLILTPICHVINASFTSGKYPEQLKIAEIIPLYKKGNRQDLGNYRAISLQSSFSKLFERAVYNRLLKFFTKYNLISPTQHGFLPGRGTDTALYAIIRDLNDLIESDSAAYGVFLDLSKAFDCLDHGALLCKLEFYGVRGVPLEWLRSYLSQRRQLVRVGLDGQSTVKSEICRSRDMGVPQGSILGPLLFITYINDFHRSVDTFRASLINYADDASVISPHLGRGSGTDTEALMDSVHFWLQSNKLLLNIEKTKYVMFTTNRSSIEAAPQLNFGGGSIAFTQSYSILGVIVDDKLDFRKHAQSVADRLSRSSYGIRIIARNTSRPTTFAAYYGLIYPVIRYCIIVWGGSAETERVFILQKRILRIMLGLDYRHSCRGLFRQHSLLTVCGTYIFECLMFVRRHGEGFVGCRAVHGYPTRRAADFVYPNHRYTRTEKLPHYSMLRFYNKVPTDIRSLESSKKFRAEIFKYICDIEPYTVGEFMQAR